MGAPIEIDEARRLVLERSAVLGSEQLAVRAALGRVLAEEVTSADAVPGFDNSAMDGYAVRAADTAGAGAAAVRLRVVDESRAGHPARRPVGEGETIAISTGAMVPPGADAVVRVEDTDAGSELVEVRAEVAPGRDIRRAGEDIAAGDTVLRPGSELGPAELGVLASVGRSRVACRRRPRVAVLTTGDELQEPGDPLRAGAIRNSNAHSIPALAERSGAEPTGGEIVPDRLEATVAALSGALEAEIAVVCGGVSVGEHDHVRPALERLGVEQVFWRVALRPGAPTYFGVARGGGLVFGLPGNPVSAMVTFLLFVRPAIRAMLGSGDPARTGRARTAAELPVLASRTQAVRCRLELGDEGWVAHPAPAQGSHVLTSMLGADALALVPAGERPLAAGTTVAIELLP